MRARISFSGGSCSAAGPTVQRALPIVKGEETPADEKDAWEWLRNPLPPAQRRCPVCHAALATWACPTKSFFTDRGFGSLGFLEQQAVGQALEPGFLREHNPIIRHTVLAPPPDAGRSGPLGADRRGCSSRPGCASRRIRGRRV